jgi:hypothetical protein
MPRKTKADLIAENERLRSKVREIYAAYHDVHNLWVKSEDRWDSKRELENLHWTLDQMRWREGGFKERIDALEKRLSKRKKPASVKT